MVLETADGSVHIEGETVFSTHDIHHNDKTFSVQAMKQENANFPALQQAGVRYRGTASRPTACSNAPTPSKRSHMTNPMPIAQALKICE